MLLDQQIFTQTQELFNASQVENVGPFHEWKDLLPRDIHFIHTLKNIFYQIKHLIIWETFKYVLCLKCHHMMETLRTHEFCMID